MPIKQNAFSSIGKSYSSGGTLLVSYNSFDWCDVDRQWHQSNEEMAASTTAATHSDSIAYSGLDLVQYRFSFGGFEPFTDTTVNPTTTLCAQLWTEDAINRFADLIDRNYAWAPSLDKVPAALAMDDGSVSYNMKVPLGYKENGNVYIYNHLDMQVKVAPVPNKESTFNIVGFEVEPKSIN